MTQATDITSASGIPIVDNQNSIRRVIGMAVNIGGLGLLIHQFGAMLLH
jgi:hypothetical protein